MAGTPSRTLESLKFDNQALARLPVDPDDSNHTRRVRGACFSKVKPPGLKNPQLVAVADEALALLELGGDQTSRPEFAEYFTGTKVLPGSDTAAHCYCGHQFGSFAGQLGDGAAMYLGEVVNGKGERWELQLKGAGPTPYSRDGDGHKVLRSSIREFLCSEAMHHLGIPTTRAGSVVTSDSYVTRDMFYDGHPKQERVTVVSRIAPTFLRFGSFEIFKPDDSFTGRGGPSRGLEHEMLPTMLDFTIQQYFPQLWTSAFPRGTAAAAANGTDDSLQERKQQLYRDFFREVVRLTASLVAQWQCVGFCHGVLNTDNMSILGLTIDYGPFGFMDRHDPDYICNSSDDTGRYAYKQQRDVCRWNLEKLAEALRGALPLDLSRPELAQYDSVFDSAYLHTMRRKLGLLKALAGQDEADLALVEALLDTMHATGADFTNTFRSLAVFPLPPPTAAEGLPKDHQYPNGGLLEQLVGSCAAVEELVAGLQPRLPVQELQMLQLLALKEPNLLYSLGVNPQMVLQELERHDKALELRKMSPEVKAQKDRERWSAWLQRYGQRLQLEANAGAQAEERRAAMLSANPRLVLRNWIAQVAIDAAERGSYIETAEVLEALRHPYDDSMPLPRCILERGGAASGSGTEAVPPEGHGGVDSAPVAPTCMRVPSWAAGLRVSCSS